MRTAVQVHTGQGITAETSGILTGGWQTDKESAYVEVSGAREHTQVYVSREDLGEQGMDVGAIERLGERMRQSRAQEASITRAVEEKVVQRQARIESQIDRDREIDRDQELDHGFGIEQPSPRPPLGFRAARRATHAAPHSSLAQRPDGTSDDAD
jgi:hypothetical protein